MRLHIIYEKRCKLVRVEVFKVTPSFDKRHELRQVFTSGLKWVKLM